MLGICEANSVTCRMVMPTNDTALTTAFFSKREKKNISELSQTIPHILRKILLNFSVRCLAKKKREWWLPLGNHLSLLYATENAKGIFLAYLEKTKGFFQKGSRLFFFFSASRFSSFCKKEEKGCTRRGVRRFNSAPAHFQISCGDLDV